MTPPNSRRIPLWALVTIPTGICVALFMAVLFMNIEEHDKPFGSGGFFGLSLVLVILAVLWSLHRWGVYRLQDTIHARADRLEGMIHTMPMEPVRIYASARVALPVMESGHVDPDVINIAGRLRAKLAED